MSRFQWYRKWVGGYWYRCSYFGWIKIGMSSYIRSIDRAKYMHKYDNNLYEDWS